MTRTITALFDDRKDAEAAQERLKQSRVDADHIRIHDKSSDGYNETTRRRMRIAASGHRSRMPSCPTMTVIPMRKVYAVVATF